MAKIAFDLKVAPACKAYHMRGDEKPLDILLPAWRRASRFAVRLYGPKTQANLGKKKLSTIAKALHGFPELERVATEFYSAKRNLNEDENLFALGTTRVAHAEAILAASESIFWQVGLWEDLTLFSGADVVFECLSHERDALLFGEPEWLLGLGAVELHEVKRTRFPIFGTALEPGAVQLLRATPDASG